MKLTSWIGIIVLVVVGAFFVLKPAPVADTQLTTDFLLSGELVSYFAEELEAPIVERLGQPIEGFTPAILTSEYKQLAPKDFDRAEALQGVYEYKGGTLEFVLGDTDVPHSAADTLTQEGMRTVLSNLGTRLGIVVDSKGEIDTIIESLR